MFDAIKAKLKDLWTTKYSWMDQDPPHEEEEELEEGWALIMRTNSWVDEYEELHPMLETIIQGNNDGTWMETLDQFLDVLSKHYGYNIKEQVYYSVAMPINGVSPYTGEVMAGSERSLNDEVLQQLLLAYPEVYDWKGHEGFKL